jgi:hypothetical protein
MYQWYSVILFCTVYFVQVHFRSEIYIWVFVAFSHQFWCIYVWFWSVNGVVFVHWLSFTSNHIIESIIVMCLLYISLFTDSAISALSIINRSALWTVCHAMFIWVSFCCWWGKVMCCCIWLFELEWSLFSFVDLLFVFVHFMCIYCRSPFVICSVVSGDGRCWK